MHFSVLRTHGDDLLPSDKFRITAYPGVPRRRGTYPGAGVRTPAKSQLVESRNLLKNQVRGPPDFTHKNRQGSKRRFIPWKPKTFFRCQAPAACAPGPELQRISSGPQRTPALGSAGVRWGSGARKKNCGVENFPYYS